MPNIIKTILDTIRDREFFYHRTNIHKHIWISNIMCYFGRHDYEFIGLMNDWALLECFYCGHQRKSK